MFYYVFQIKTFTSILLAVLQEGHLACKKSSVCVLLMVVIPA